MNQDPCEDVYAGADLMVTAGDGSALQEGASIPYLWGGQGSAFTSLSLVLAGTGNAVSLHLRLHEGGAEGRLIGEGRLSSEQSIEVLQCAVVEEINQGWSTTLQILIDDSIEPDSLAGNDGTLMVTAEYTVDGQPASVNWQVSGVLELQ